MEEDKKEEQLAQNEPEQAEAGSAEQKQEPKQEQKAEQSESKRRPRRVPLTNARRKRLSVLSPMFSAYCSFAVNRVSER